MDHSPEILKIWGHCNGFLCVTSMDETEAILLWNPYTRESKKVPDAPNCKCVYMFGYDAAAEDYIVVSVCRYESHSKVEIYSSRKNSWRKMQDIPYTIGFYDNYGYFVNGSFYWVARPHIDLRDVIVNYQPVTGEVVEVPLPDYAVSSYGHLAVRLVDGNLFVLLYNGWREDCETWLVKKCATESWTELGASFGIGYLPFSYINNGTRLLLCHEKYGLSFYDFESGTRGGFNIQDSHGVVIGIPYSPRSLAEATIYIESVAPLCHVSC